MPDVIITPASGQIDFQDNNSSKALMRIDANGNLAITNTGGSLSVGNTAADVYIGDGINNVNLRFERAGSILPGSGQPLTLGSQTSGPIHIGRELRLKPNAATEGGELQFDYINGNVGYFIDVEGGNRLRFGNSDTTGTYVWTGNNNERMRLMNGGALKVTTDGSYVNSALLTNEFVVNSIYPSLIVENRNFSYASTLSQNAVYRSASNGYTFVLYASGAYSDNEFIVRGDGVVFSDGGTTMSTPADYAEMFEWEDGNPNNEDRRGYSVTLVGTQIRKSIEGDENIIGVVSGNPAVLADNAWNHWADKYLKDEFNCYIWEEHNVLEWKQIITDESGTPMEVTKTIEDWNIPEGVIVPEDAIVKTHEDNGKRFMHRKLNPEYDATQEYISREDRPEWSPVGLVGKLRLRKGQPVAERWIKMRDISATVEEWLVR
jgi:hypothetical protein